MQELIDKHVAIHYAFPTHRVEKHNLNIMKYIDPNIITGEWSGGEFIGGNASFYKQLYQEISGFSERYFQKINEMFHQGDEMLTSIAIEKMKLNGWKIIDGGTIDLIYRYYSIFEDKTINNYKSWMYHLICDKHFLANMELTKYKTNEDFIKMYNHYFHTTIKVKKIYHRLKNSLLKHR